MGVRMESWFHQRLQHYFRHPLRHAIRDRGYPTRTQLPFPLGTSTGRTGGGK